jgi:hypothetical protein
MDAVDDGSGGSAGGDGHINDEEKHSTIMDDNDDIVESISAAFHRVMAKTDAHKNDTDTNANNDATISINGIVATMPGSTVTTPNKQRTQAMITVRAHETELKHRAYLMVTIDFVPYMIVLIVCTVSDVETMKGIRASKCSPGIGTTL